MEPIIKVDVSHMFPYTAKVIIFHTPEWFIEKYTEDWLEDNLVFAFCFDVSPSVVAANDYTPVLKAFPNSDRVMDKSLFIGNYDDEDWESVIEQCLKQWVGDYEVIDREELK